MILNDVYKRLHDDRTVEYITLPFKPILTHFKDIDFYYLEISYCTRESKDEVYNPSYNLEEYVPKNVLTGIINDDKSHLLVLTTEHHTFMCDDIYRFIKKFNIPESKVILVCEIPDVGQAVQKVADKYMLKTIPYYYLPIDEFIIHSQLFKLKEHFKQLITLENKRYKTSYLNFNRRWRMHRFLFVSLLVSHKIVNRGLVSLGDTKEYPTNKLEFYQSLMNEKFLDNETKTILNDNKDQILNMSDLHVDDMDLSKPELCVSLHSTENSHFPYKETYVSVISETLFFEDLPLRYTKDVGRFVTEKTFKAIAHKHPFILIAPYKTLSLMKTLGYKTFSPFIDESYDDIENDMERMKYILKEVQRLDSLNEDELANFIKNLIPIAEYNFNLLLNKQLGEFITRIG